MEEHRSARLTHSVPLPVGIEVAEAGEDDLHDLARLRWDWQLAQGEIPEFDLDQFADRFAAWTRDRSRTHRAFIARQGSVPLGMAWLVVTERLPGPGRWTRANGYVATLYVEPSARGGGIGVALMSTLIRSAVELGIDILQVHPSEQAMSLYRRLGFDNHEGALELLIS